MIKKIVIRVIVLLAVFMGSFTLISHLMNQTNVDKTMVMAGCTLPTVSMSYQDVQINQLFGYTGNMQATSMRDTITPLDAENKLPMQIQTYGTVISNISYEVRSIDGVRLIEETQVSDWEEKDAVIDLRLNIQDLLSDDTEYLLTIKLATKEYDQISYYTRIMKDSNFATKEKLDFVLSFHQRTFDKDQSIVSNLESNSSSNNSSYHNVDIHSSFAQVTFGDLQPEQTGVMQVQLEELNSQTAVLVLRYQAVIEDDQGEKRIFATEEFYRVRYTKDRMYLLEFEREMDEVFVETNKVYYNHALSLGVTSDQVPFLSNADGTIVSFVQQGDLYCYNSNNHTTSRVFGFSDQADIRYQNQDHQIKIVNVDESGSTDFIVTGYMNRGSHEGEVGVAVYHYDSVINAVEEQLFIVSDKPYQMLKEEIGQLAYISRKGIFYVSFAGSIYAVSMDSQQSEVLVDSVQEGTVVSADNVQMAWQKEQVLHDSKTLELLNFDSGELYEIKANETERLKPIGFIGNDFIYGVARESDIQSDGSGQPVFAMYKVVILDEKHKVVKEYEQSGIYITQGVIKDNMVNLTRVSQDASGSYNAVKDDQIVHSVAEETTKVVLASITTEKYKKEYQLQFERELSDKKVNCLYPKEVKYEEREEMQLPQTEQSLQYYVYAKGKLDSLFTDAVSAIRQADQIAGVVVNEKQQCIYERVKRLTKNQMTSIATISASDTMDSLSASLNAIYGYYGITADARSQVVEGKSALDILNEQLGKENVINLSGLSLDQVLYLISRNVPILVKLDAVQYGVLVGYNELNTVVMNPQTGQTGYVGMEDSKKMFENAGSFFVGCLN